jgi:hypothetical protein
MKVTSPAPLVPLQFVDISFLILAAAASPLSALRAHRITFAPFRAISRADSKPIPVFALVKLNSNVRYISFSP